MNACIKHNPESCVVYNAEKFEFICNDCSKIITKADRETFDKTVAMLEFIKGLGEVVA